MPTSAAYSHCGWWGQKWNCASQVCCLTGDRMRCLFMPRTQLGHVRIGLVACRICAPMGALHMLDAAPDEQARVQRAHRPQHEPRVSDCTKERAGATRSCKSAQNGRCARVQQGRWIPDTPQRRQGLRRQGVAGAPAHVPSCTTNGRYLTELDPCTPTGPESPPRCLRPTPRFDHHAVGAHAKTQPVHSASDDVGGERLTCHVHDTRHPLRQHCV